MNILLTSAGRRTYLVDYFKQVLRGKGQVHAANAVFSSALNKADQFVETPLIYDTNYIPFLLDYVKENDIKVVISLFDIDLPVLAKSKERFKEIGVEVIVSEYDVTEICNDKWRTFQFLIQHGFKTPRTYKNYEEALKELDDGVFSYPVILKPRWGMGSIGIYTADDRTEFQVLYQKIKKEIATSYLKFESKASMEESVIIQELISGQEYGLDIFNNLEGHHLKTFVKKKLAMRSGETDMAVTEDHRDLQNLGRDLSLKLKHVGNLDCDCFLTNSGIYILEMNCRFGGGYPFTHLAGANLPKVLVNLVESNGYDIADLDMEYGIKMAKEIVPVKIKE